MGGEIWCRHRQIYSPLKLSMKEKEGTQCWEFGARKIKLLREFVWTWSLKYHRFYIPEDRKSISFLIKQCTQGIKGHKTVVKRLMIFTHWAKWKQRAISKLWAFRGQLLTSTLLKGMSLSVKESSLRIYFLLYILWQFRTWLQRLDVYMDTIFR